MDYDAILDQVVRLLQREQRLSYRVLKRRLQLDDETLEDLKEDLIYAKQLAVDEEGKVLVWAGGAGTGATATAPAGEPARPPRSYTPPYLAEKILTSRSALEGERKQVTVLFADLKGSMELLADRDPEDARAILDPVLEKMMDAVHRYEGTVNQVMGDGIMALFGAPIAHEDHAVRACYAALAMQGAVKQYAVEVQRSKGVPIQMRVGLNAGEVVVRSIGNDLHMDYSAVGQTTHLAARMEQLATPGSILLTAHTLRLVEGLVQVKALGPVPVKGLPEPAEVFELVGASALRGRFQARVAGGLTRFVGRETERAALVQAVERAGAGHGQVVAVVGEAGVGKSHLVYECVHVPHLQGWRVLESAAVPYGKATPYFPVIDLVRRYTRVEERDDVGTIRAKVTGQVLTLAETLQETIPALLSLLEALPEDSPFRTFDPPQRRQRMLDALQRLLLRESRVQPLLLVFEDLHWIDSETQALLDSLVERLPTARFLLLVNYRPEYQHGWGSKTYYTQLRLDPLPAASAAEVLQVLLGDDPSLTPLKQLLIARTEGNPFFLEESVCTLVEKGVLMGEPGAHCLAQALPTIQVPATVQAVLAARIDRLPPEDKRLLQTAAVIGKDGPVALLQAIAELPEEELRRGLTHLQAAEFLHETSLFPELEYTFKHALTHEVAYDSLLQERRRALHGRIVDAIERLHPDRLSEQVERLAHHALWGNVWDKAVTYCRQAGAKAFERSVNWEAVACFEQALQALQHVPESQVTREQSIDLRFDLRQALVPLGELGRIHDALQEAERLATALEDQPRLGRALSYLSQYYWLRGDYDHAVTSGQHALAMATARGDFALQVVTNFYLGRAYHIQGHYHQAIIFYTKTMMSLEGDLIHARFDLAGFPSVFSRSYLALCLAQLGEFAEAIARGEEGVRISEVGEQPYSLALACAALGEVYLRHGEVDRAISVLEHSCELCRVWDMRILFPRIAATSGYAYALAGRLPEALPLLEQALGQAGAMNMMDHHALWLACLGEAYLLACRMDDARGRGARALELAHAYKERGHQAWTLRLLGDIATHRDPPEVAQASTRYRQAFALAEELGMHPLQAHCHRGLGTLYAKTGQREQAHTELSTAITMYRTMDMTFWLPEVEAALAQVEGR
jgi:class 3 adenylate cyclase/tetratricopeptide (TPR) repeat protein